MLKKIVLGTLLVGLIGILVTGAVTRTMDKTERVAEAHGYGRGQGEAINRAEGGLAQGQRRGNSQTGAYVAGGAGRGRSGYGSQMGEDAPAINSTSQAQVEEWLTLQGTVVSVDADTLVVQTVSGEQVTVENRAWWFAQEQGFSAQVGHQVTLIGFYEGDDPSTDRRGERSPEQSRRIVEPRRGERSPEQSRRIVEPSGLHFEVGQIDDATSGQTVLVRDENGRPLWAGRGRRAQRL